MILDIDHVAFSSPFSFQANISLFEQVGYKKYFITNQIKNLAIKKCFLWKKVLKHDLCLLNKKDSFNIEVINYGYVRKSKSFYSLFTKNDFKLEDIYSLNNTFQKFFKDDNCHIDDLKFNKILLQVNNLNQSKKLWLLLGFKIVDIFQGFVVLNFKSFITKKDYYLYLSQKKNCNMSFLDDHGFNCIGFISTSILKDREILKKNGFFVTSISSIRLNERNLNIFFAKGQNGELIELISFDK